MSEVERWKEDVMERTIKGGYWRGREGRKWTEQQNDDKGGNETNMKWKNNNKHNLAHDAEGIREEQQSA
jgi:hypothetical protein